MTSINDTTNGRGGPTYYRTLTESGYAPVNGPKVP